MKAFQIGQEEAATSFLCVSSIYVLIKLVPWTPFNCVRTIGQLSMWAKMVLLWFKGWGSQSPTLSVPL